MVHGVVRGIVIKLSLLNYLDYWPVGFMRQGCFMIKKKIKRREVAQGCRLNTGQHT